MKLFKSKKADNGPQIDLLEKILQISVQEVRTDRQGSELVLLSHQAENFAAANKEVRSKTSFEAFINHVHLMEGLTASDLKRLRSVAPVFCRLLAEALHSRFPDRHFFVYAIAGRGEEFIVRFHQVWEGETPYAEPSESASGWVIREEV